MISKKELIEQLVSRSQAGVDALASAAETSRQDAIEAEGRMQTRYGCAKELNSYLADGLNARVAERSVEAARLRAVDLSNDSFIVQEGSLVRLEDIEGQEFVDYFLLPCCGGEVLGTKNGDVTVVTPESPLGKAMIGLDIGEPFSVSVANDQKQYRVANVS